MKVNWRIIGDWSVSTSSGFELDADMIYWLNSGLFIGMDDYWERRAR